MDACSDRKIEFTRVPLGGGGLVPNLLSGNIDAVVLYSPLTYKVMQDKEARSLIDYGAEVPAHSTGELDRHRQDHQGEAAGACRRR